jgi:hypothetical protein
LIHAGYVRSDEVGQAISLIGSMKDVTDAALIDELSGRLETLRARLVGHDGEGWSAAGWATQDPGVGRVKHGD